ncbi:dienelactone hydrolase family protein [Kribbella sp. CA-253562]|uniref:dienelactone hydrolase family protein n=1 Tax=Kribbella sp. CA-253562 TaxID=3239942 RepID=UPI003D944139
MSFQFTAQTSADGVLTRSFALGEIAGVLWSPASSAGPTPLVLLGHGGGRDSKAPPMVGRAHRLVSDAGFSVACIDAPGHGGRPRSAIDEREIAAMQQAMATGEPVGPIVVRYNLDLAERAVPEWQATLDALQQLPDLADGPVGYFGLNLGTAIGVPLLAAEPRISAAVLGIFWYDDALAKAAAQITVPVEFLVQWNDEHIPRTSSLALFDAFASAEKSLHANAGAHKDVPRFEFDSAVRFFVRHLSRRRNT